MPPKSKAKRASSISLRSASPLSPSWPITGGRRRLPLDAMPVSWDEGDKRKGPRAPPSRSCSRAALMLSRAFVGNENGNAKQAIANAVKKVEAVYAFPYQNHATMEPMNATRGVYGGSLRGMGADAERRGHARRHR